MSTSRQRKLTGYPTMSDRQLDVLRRLRNAVDGDTLLFVDLSDVHPKTLRSLCAYDLMLASPGRDGVRYKATGRGLKTLRAYEQPTRRTDGICPRCNERPRRVRKKGTHKGELAPYCGPCESRISRRKAALGIQHLNPETPCSRCKKRPRHRYPSGKLITYCAHCRRVLRKKERRRKHKNKLKRIAAGELIQCSARDAHGTRCEQPVYHTANTVYDYCYAHYRAYMTDYNDRRRAESNAARRRQEAKATS